MGELLLGPLLGLGPEGNVGADRAPLLYHNLARPLGRVVDAIRAREPGYPICAIAGINAGNASDVIAAGVDGVAVISALSLAPDPGQAAQGLRAVVDSALKRRGRP